MLKSFKSGMPNIFCGPTHVCAYIWFVPLCMWIPLNMHLCQFPYFLSLLLVACVLRFYLDWSLAWRQLYFWREGSSIFPLLTPTHTHPHMHQLTDTHTQCTHARTRMHLLTSTHTPTHASTHWLTLHTHTRPRSVEKAEDRVATVKQELLVSPFTPGPIRTSPYVNVTWLIHILMFRISARMDAPSKH